MKDITQLEWSMEGTKNRGTKLFDYESVTITNMDMIMWITSHHMDKMIINWLYSASSIYLVPLWTLLEP